MSSRVCSVSGCGRSGKLTRGMCAKDYRYWLDHTPPEQRGLAPRFARDFFSLVTRRHAEGCWSWNGPRNRQGYGLWGKKLAHRHSWEIANGAIPDGLWILHHCDNKPCINPAHLYAGTVVENVQDAIDRGRWPSVGSTRTHCTEGHELAGDNLIVIASPAGRPWKRCRICDNERKRLSAQRTRARRKASA